jgi:hypothetical protein
MGGLPARVASGFTSGTHNPRTGVWSVTDIDAHAWVEVWFPQYGWVRFDPTPKAAPARGGSITALNDAFHRHITSGNPFKAKAATSSTTTSKAKAAAGHRRGGGGGSGQGAGSPWPWIGGGAGALLALLAGWELAARMGARTDALSELERALRRTGRPLKEGTTLVGVEHRFASAPQAAAYIRALRVQRYGGVGEPPSSSGRRALRSELSAGLGFSGRMRSWWALPPRPSGLSRPRRPGSPSA